MHMHPIYIIIFKKRVCISRSAATSTRLRYILLPPVCFSKVRYFLSENNRVDDLCVSFEHWYKVLYNFCNSAFSSEP